MKDVDHPKADKQIEIAGLQADALADLGRAAEAVVELDDRWGQIVSDRGRGHEPLAAIGAPSSTGFTCAISTKVAA